MPKQMWNEIPAGRVNRAIQQFLYALGGDAGKVIGRMCDDDLAIELAIFAKEEKVYLPELTTSQELAREIMGTNFFGTGEAIKYFGIDPSEKECTTLTKIPFTADALYECKDTHILVAVFPMSILDVRKADSSLFYSSSGGWYESEKFAKSKGTVSWQLVSKTPVADSTSKNWDEQQALLGKDDETPTSQVMVYTIIGHYRNTGERLFENVCVRTSCVRSGDRRVHAGYFGSVGLLVVSSWDDDRDSHLGLSSARKSLTLNL